MEVRPMTPADMDDLIKIWLDASKEAHHFVPAEYWESRQAEMRNVYLPMSETYLIEDAGGIQGFVSMVENDLAALFVNTGQQNQGYGKALLHCAMNLRDVLKLRVYEKNQRAFRFYIKNGFEVLDVSVDSDTGQKEQVLIWSSSK